jgi:hypothetical protein
VAGEPVYRHGVPRTAEGLSLLVALVVVVVA